jgi:hypothetical protein
VSAAALKQKAPEPTPTPFASPERATLAAAIAAAADAGARREALVKAVSTAEAEVRAARVAAEATETALLEAQGNATQHRVALALGTAGAPPLSVRQVRAASIAAADDLEEARATRDALKAELDGHDNGLLTLRVQDAAIAVLRAEMAGRGVALAARVAEMQRQLVAAASGLEWLASAGVFPTVNGRPADDAIRHTVWRMESAPRQWATVAERPGAVPFAVSTGAQRWQAAFEALKRDPTTPLPVDLP